MKLRLLLITLSISFMGWGQTTLTNFKFENNLTPEVGAIGSPNLTSSTTVSYFGGVTGQAASFASAGGKYFELVISTLGYSSVDISFAGRSSQSGTSWILTGDETGGTTFASITSLNCGNGSFTNLSPTILGANYDNKTSIRLRITASSTTATLRIDDLILRGVSACSPPVDPSGTISATTSCGSSSLSYSSPSATAYWQTSATGTDTSFPTTSSYTATASGTYYVRVFNASCWSTNAVSQSVTVVNPVSITTQPTNQASTTGATATFTVAASNAASYQWQVSTNGGSSWSNVGTSSNSYTTPATTLGMNGYLYRVLVSGTAPCGALTSSEATLTVTTGPCLSQSTFSSAPSGWLENSITYSGGEAVFAANAGDLTTVSLSNPTSLTFDLRRTTNTSAKDLIIEVSTTTQTGTFTIVTTYNLGNTTSGGTTSCTVDLSSYTPFSTVYIRFRKVSSTASPWYIQNVNVFCGTPPSGPEINVTGNGITIVDGDTSPSSADNTNFGSVLISTNIVQTFVIQNLGTTDLNLSLPITLSDTSLPQEFTITQPSVSTIVSGGSTSFTVTFSSAVAGLFTNTINISNSDSDESLYNFDILAIASNSVSGGTTFRPGELIFTGYDGQINGNGAEDEYLVATLVDILPGTVFSIVNSRYEAGAAAGVRTNKWGGGGDDPSESPYQADITYNGSTSIPAGSVLQIITNGTANWFGTISVITNNISSNRTSDFSGSIVGGTFLTPNISTSSPDQMYLVQGNFTSDGSIDANQANYYLSGTLLHGLTNRAAWVPLANACSGSSATTSANPRESRLPAALTCFNVESISSSAVSGYYENDKEHGTASIYQIINAVADVSNNWTLGTGRYNLNPTNVVATSAGRTFIIGSSNPSGQWVGDVDTNWFNCANWSGLAVPDANTDVIITSSATNVARVDYTAAYSDIYTDLAVCNDISILGSKVEILASNNNVLEVFGDLLIDTSGILDMDDSNSGTTDGQLLLHGNWTNNLTNDAFEEGNGTVVFKGVTDQVINAVAPEGTEVFYDVVLNNNFTTSVSNNLIASGDLLVEIGKTVTVNADDYIQVNNDLTVDGNLTVLNDGSLIQVNDAGVNVGDIDYERTTTGNSLDYVYWSSPTESSFTPNSGNIYIWNPTQSNLNGGNGYWNLALGTSMDAGKGYIMRDVFSRTFTGVARNGIISVPIERADYTGADYPGNNGVTITNLDDNLNLVGNPYPSSINAIDFLLANPNIEGAVRIWTHGISPSSSIQNPFYGSYQANYSVNDYVIYNSTGASFGPSTFNGLIAGGQGFFTIMNDGAAATETVVFNNSMRDRTYDNSQFYRTASGSNKHRIWLELKTDINQSAKTLVGYVEGATLGKDRMFDAVALEATQASIYSIVEEKNMSIQGRFPFNDEDIVSLGVKITKNGSNTIGIFALDGLFSDQDIYLEDLYLHIIHDLKTTPYTFDAPKGVFNDRFILRFKNTNVLSDELFSLDENLVEIHTGSFIEIKSTSKSNIKSVSVYDILARKMVDEKNINQRELTLKSLNKNNVPLIVLIELEDGYKISKKIIF